MSSKTVLAATFSLLALSLVSSTGCSVPFATTFGPSVHFPWPLPITPLLSKEQEDKFWVKERYGRVPILGPTTAGGPAVALDPPSADEVMRALERARPVQRGVPFLHERQRNNVRMIVEPIADYVDPPRVYPLIGAAQLHHAHYKCTIYYSEVTRVGYPIPYTTVDEDTQEVIYIDHNHFHVIDTGDGAFDGATAGL